MDGGSRRAGLDRYRGIIGEWEEFTQALAVPEPEVLRVNSGKIAAGALARRLSGHGFKLRRVEGVRGFLEVESGPSPLSATIEHWLGHFYIQRASTGLAAPVLGVRRGDRVLDLCAAPGGKASHLADLVGADGCVVANEANEGRARALLGNVYRLGQTNLVLTVGDGRALPESATFDRALVDVPCSGEGTARRKGGRVRPRSRSFSRHLAKKQRALLAKAVDLVRPGGTILYVTCTFAPEENEAVVADVLRARPVEIDPIYLRVRSAPGLIRFQGADYGNELSGTVRIYPHHLNSGGLFMARLVKAGAGAVDGWERVPLGRVDREPTGWVGHSDAVGDPGAVGDSIALARSELARRFGVAREALEGVHWRGRGGRLWLHGVEEWPAWMGGSSAVKGGANGSCGTSSRAGTAPARGGQGRGRYAAHAPTPPSHARATPARGQGRGRRTRGVRPVAVGFRAIEFDTKGRPRPTNDLLRWLDRAVTQRVLELGREDLVRLLTGEQVTASTAALGPHALRYGNDVIGRVAATRTGLRSEIPRARSGELLRVLSAIPPRPPTPPRSP